MSLPPVPEHFTCPIILDVMNDLVIATKSGVTYDRTALLQSLEIKPECPSTRLPMTSDDLIPNLALKSMIEAWQNPRQTEQLKLEVLTLDCVKTSEMESDSDSDESEDSETEEDLFAAELEKIHLLEMHSFDVEMEKNSDID